MCLIAFSIGVSERWPLVIASNRDEFFDRPALPLSRWRTPAGQEIISGQDLRAGGTWLGITPSGRIAMLTNVREPLKQMADSSRGELPLRWLSATTNARSFLTEVDSGSYGPCNLVLGDFQRGEWTWASNRPEPIAQTDVLFASGWYSRKLESGIYGLSNAALDTPWPKTLALKLALGEALQTASDSEKLRALLLQALQNRHCAQPQDLPHTGVPSELERALSSAFVEQRERGYGTRCSTFLVVEARRDTRPGWHDVLMQEKTYQQHRAPDQGLALATASVQLPWRAAMAPH